MLDGPLNLSKFLIPATFVSTRGKTGAEQGLAWLGLSEHLERAMRSRRAVFGDENISAPGVPLV